MSLIVFDNFPAYSQKKILFKTSANNLFRYGNGEENLYSNSVKKEYFENFTDVQLSVNNFTMGMRLEISNPAELGLDFKGIRKRYFEYTTDDFNVRAGDFEEIVGRGLTLNCYEQRELAFDTGLDGIRIIYKKSFTQHKSIRLKSEILGGSLEYSDYQRPERIEKYSLKNFNLESTFFSLFSLGFNFVYAKGNIPTGNTLTEINAYLPEVFFTLNTSKFQLFSTYARKKTDVSANIIYPVNFSSYGDGYYFSGNYSIPGIGVTFEYKNYRFDLTTPDNQSLERPTKVLPFQNPPTALKQQTSVLTSRISHPVDFNDDLGMQVDIAIVPSEQLLISLNAAVSSRHYSFYDADTTSKINFTAIKRKLGFLPSFNESMSPNVELSAEVEYDILKELKGKIGLFYQRRINYNYFFNQSSEKIQYITIPAEVRYNLSNLTSVILRLETQIVRDAFGLAAYQNYSNYFMSCGLSRSPDLSFTVNADFTTDKYDPSGKSKWIEAEVIWKLTSSNILSIAYGSERGGLRCSGGICKFINPFNGFRMTFQSIFE